MDNPRQQPLARTCFALQQQRRDGGMPEPIEGRQMADLHPQGAHGGGIADEAIDGVGQRPGAWVCHSDLALRDGVGAALQGQRWSQGPAKVAPF
jgi:hypothetical protein